MELSITVCDVCQDPSRKVKRYTLQQGERSATVDLCDEDSSALEALLPKGATSTASKVRTPVRKKAAAKKVTTEKVTAGSAGRRGGRAVQETKIEDIK
ncbi:hypothetical protein AB0J80_36125 [Actinoplanes sp. NPDC049548]|uniref:hypothetical protein n=1 Tax=Actinoplanes sp. NPDC049548 TaxID=3155152 RepID=UPI00343847D9